MTERDSARPRGFGPYIKALREARPGLKQRQIADFVGMSQSQFSGMENNANPEYLPAPGVVARIAEFFGVSEVELLQQAGYLQNAASTTATPAATIPHGLLPRIAERIQQITVEELLNQGADEAHAMADAIEEADAQRAAQKEVPRRRRAVS